MSVWGGQEGDAIFPMIIQSRPLSVVLSERRSYANISIDGRRCLFCAAVTHHARTHISSAALANLSTRFFLPPRDTHFSLADKWVCRDYIASHGRNRAPLTSQSFVSSIALLLLLLVITSMYLDSMAKTNNIHSAVPVCVYSTVSRRTPRSSGECNEQVARIGLRDGCCCTCWGQNSDQSDTKLL